MQTGLKQRLQLYTIALLFAVALFPQLGAQATPSANTRDEGERHEVDRATSTHEFLGLGRMPDAKMAAEGAKIFGPTCGFCHGADARGASAPDLLRSPVVLDDNQADLIGPTIHNGRPGKGMPAFPAFTNDDVRNVAEYLHQQVELAANRGTYKTLNIVTGNASAGDSYFHGAGKCNTCHSTTGDLAHIASKMTPPDLQQAFLYPARRDRSNAKVTVVARDGKHWTGTVKHLDDFYVSFNDLQGNYHSIPLEKGVEVHLLEEEQLLAHRQMLDRYTNQQMHDLTAYLVTLR